MRKIFLFIFFSLSIIWAGNLLSRPLLKFYATGVGLEERKALGVKYPLKVIISTKGGDYLSFVTLKIYKGKKLFATIPEEKITGPWVYLDLPDGTYKVVAIRKNGKKTGCVVNIKKGVTRTIFLSF